MKTFGRVITAMITPFLEDGSVDLKGAVKLGKHLLANGSDGLIICGTTGEGATIPKEEKIALFKAMVDNCSNDGTIIANTGSNDTLASVELTKAVEELGVDGVMAVVPYYNKPNQEGCYQHFSAIAKSTKLPIIVYNVPGRTSASIKPETVKRLADEFSNIVAVKDATGNLNYASEIGRICPEGFMIYSGEDSLVLPMLSVGGCGVISVTSHVAGVEMNEMIQAFENGDMVKALKIHREILPLCNGMFITTNPIPVKTAMKLMELPAGPFHLPLVDASKEEEIFIKNLLKKYNKC